MTPDGVIFAMYSPLAFPTAHGKPHVSFGTYGHPSGFMFFSWKRILSDFARWRDLANRLDITDCGEPNIAFGAGNKRLRTDFFVLWQPGIP